MTRTRIIILVMLFQATFVASGAWSQAQDPDCTLRFIGQVRSEFQSQVAATEIVKVFVILTKRVTNPAGRTNMFVTCDAPDKGKDEPASDHDANWEAGPPWKPVFALVDDPNPVGPRVDIDLDEYYPTTRPFLDEDRSFIVGDKWEVHPEDLDSPNCTYYYHNGQRKRYCW